MVFQIHYFKNVSAENFWDIFQTKSLLSEFWSFEIYLMPLTCRFSLYQTTKIFLFLLYWLTDLHLIVIGLLEFIVSLWNIWNIFTYVIPLRHDQKFSICKTSESYMKHLIQLSFDSWFGFVSNHSKYFTITLIKTMMKSFSLRNLHSTFLW